MADDPTKRTRAPFASEGSLPAGSKASDHAPLRQTVWWASLAVLLLVGWGVLQLLAMLVQAERVRGALEAGLAQAELPRAELTHVTIRTLRALDELALSNPQPAFEVNGRHVSASKGFAPSSSHPTLKLWWSMQSNPRLRSGDVVESTLAVLTDELVPDWLGPRLPGLGPEEVEVRWQITVP